MDNALLGVIIGATSTLLANVLAQWLTLRREERQWARQREAEQEDLQSRECQQEIERVQNIYVNCISRLSLLTSSGNEPGTPNKEERAIAHKEAVEWITKLKLHLRDLSLNSVSAGRGSCCLYSGSDERSAAQL